MERNWQEKVIERGGALIGYGRVSSRSQDLTIQIDALTGVGVKEAQLYVEKVSGTKREGRAQLKSMLERGLRKHDCLVITRLDRLARSTRDLLKIADILDEKGVDLVCLEQPVNTTTPEGRLFFTLLGAFGEFETAIRAARQREGIDAALAKGADSPFKGRPATIDADRVKALKADGMGATAIARELGITRQSVYRLLKATRKHAA
ncbi:recombinase family protein [Pseudophaeobacter arcticus]|uniref:Recombinase family protein n=1 Tax=Pseudophaeobacter arcticus TaxID=385492 RepID=A0ABQ0AS47_9RHOB